MKKNRRSLRFFGNRNLFSSALRLGIAIALSCLPGLPGYGQETGKRVTLEVKQQSVPEILRLIEKQVPYRFMYHDADLSDLGKKDLLLREVPLTEALKECFKGSAINYEIVGTEIVLKRVKQEQQVIAMKKITGKVTDEQGNPLPGVTVVIAGTNVGATTDAEGKYTIRCPQTEDLVLRFSFVGMKTEEVKVGEREIIHVRMQEEVTNIKEVIVTGIFQRKKESFTGAATTYTADELKTVGNQNIIQSLKSLDPAFAIIENNEYGSDPNRLPDLEIRGKSSIVGLREQFSVDPNQPLFILDGFETSLRTIMDLDMDRVESITILKDAASTAIYGSKAANGVVVVETKRPEKGQLRLSYNGNFNISMPDLSSYNLMNAEEKLQFEQLAGRYQLGSAEYTPDKKARLDDLYNKRLAAVKSGVNTYWLAEPVRIGFNHRHSLYAEGGDEVIRYGLGVNYNQVKGVMEESQRDIFGGNLDLIYRKDKLLFSNKLSVNYNKTKDPIVSYSEYARANPYYKKRTEDGKVEKWLEYIEDFEEVANPLYNASLNSHDLGNSFGITNNFSAEYNPLTSLKLRARFGVTQTITETDQFVSPQDSRFNSTDVLKKGSSYYSNSKSLQYEGEFTATYGYIFAEKHRVNLVGGGNFSSSESVTNGYSAEGFPEGNFTTPAFANGYPAYGKPNYYESESRSVNFYLNGGYAYDDRYLLDVNYRSNGSSVFGSNKRFTDTWSVGLAWNLHNESFIRKHVSWLNLWKLRASIGNPGNQNFSAYQTLTTYRFVSTTANYFGKGVFLDALGNPDLKWQVTKDRNIGLDAALFGNKLTFSVDYYNKKTDPLLVNIGVAASTGTTTVMTNLGEQTSKGVNGSVVYSPVYRPYDRVIWSLRYNFRTETSRYDHIGNTLDKFNENGHNKNLQRYFDGARPDDLYAVRSAGIDPSTGREIFIKKDGTYTFEFDYDDEVKVGVGRPKVEGIVGTSFSYKGFSCNLDFRYRWGGQAFNSAVFQKVENITSSGLRYNQDKRALYDRWQQPGDVAKYKGISLTSSTPMSSRFVEDDNSLALESCRIGYEFDQKFVRKIYLCSLRVNAYMNDIFRVSSIKTERGTQYPFARSISFSISASF